MVYCNRFITFNNLDSNVYRTYTESWTSTSHSKEFKDLENNVSTSHTETWSNSQSGYMKFSNGFLINWGRYEATDATGDIYFSCAYTSFTPRVVAQRHSNTTNVQITYNRFPYDVTKTKFTRTKASSSLLMSWVAVGF